MATTMPTQRRTLNTKSPSTGLIEGKLADLESQLDRLRAQIRQAQQLSGLGTAAMTIAHEMSNWMTPVLGMAEYALKENDSKLMQTALLRTVDNLKTMVVMSDRLLAIGAAKTGQPVDTSVRVAVEEARLALCRDFSKDGISFRCDVEESLLVRFDPLHLRMVLFNLFVNAREALLKHRNKRLRVCAEKLDDRVRVQVSDTGPGISADVLPNVFQPLESSKSCDDHAPPRCSGLGLALCRSLIVDGGGTIDVASEVGVGTTFTLILPGV
ncbi:MAG: ATP-binding protein [Planctomycetota bacterium]